MDYSVFLFFNLSNTFRQSVIQLSMLLLFDSPFDSQINSLSYQLAVFTGAASCINKNHVGAVVALAERS